MGRLFSMAQSLKDGPVGAGAKKKRWLKIYRKKSLAEQLLAAVSRCKSEAGEASGPLVGYA